MLNSAAAPRPGEISIELPDTFDAGLYFIGRISTPWRERSQCPRNGTHSDAVCTIRIDEPFAAGLQQIEYASHLVVLYWMHAAARNLAVQRPRHWGGPRGTFSIRSPARPNPIALSVVELLSVERNNLAVRGLDCLDGTALLDVKPYTVTVDCRPDARIRREEPPSDQACADIDRDGQDGGVEQE